MVIWLSRMKTTIDLPDDSAGRRRRSARRSERTSIARALVERGLRRELREGGSAARTRAGLRIRWITVRGGLPEGLELTDRAAMHDRLRRTRG